MKEKVLFTTIALFAGSMLAVNAAPQDEVAAAAKKLADAGGYTWKSTQDSGFGGPRTTQGKIDKDGVAVILFPGRDSDTMAVIKGDKAAMETQDGWQSKAELANGDQQGFSRFYARRLENYEFPPAEVESLLKQVESVTMADGVYSGKLTKEGAEARLSFRGRRGGNGPEISNASGSVKFWIKDGMITKYEYTVSGSMSFNGNDRDIDRTTTVEISNVGSTEVEVPEAAKEKLS